MEVQPLGWSSSAKPDIQLASDGGLYFLASVATETLGGTVTVLDDAGRTVATADYGFPVESWADSC